MEGFLNELIPGLLRELKCNRRGEIICEIKIKYKIGLTSPGLSHSVSPTMYSSGMLVILPCFIERCFSEIIGIFHLHLILCTFFVEVEPYSLLPFINLYHSFTNVIGPHLAPIHVLG